MSERNNLIVVHAQHPLINRVTPGLAFRERLDAAAELAENTDSDIYVAGSRHRSGMINDNLSLSQAGKTYLVKAGMPEDRIHGEDWSARFRPAGVYCAADEVLVATAGYRAEAYEGAVHAVAHNKLRGRLALHYMAYDLEPIFHIVGENDGYHESMAEAFLRAYTRFNSDWQKGVLPMIIRNSRLPNDATGDDEPQVNSILAI